VPVAAKLGNSKPARAIFTRRRRTEDILRCRRLRAQVAVVRTAVKCRTVITAARRMLQHSKIALTSMRARVEGPASVDATTPADMTAAAKRHPSGARIATKKQTTTTTTGQSTRRLCLVAQSRSSSALPGLVAAAHSAMQFSSGRNRRVWRTNEKTKKKKTKKDCKLLVLGYDVPYWAGLGAALFCTPETRQISCSRPAGLPCSPPLLRVRLLPPPPT
jgi:hypothetical protein